MTPGGTPLFRQTLLVLAGSLVLAHITGFLALALLSPGSSSATNLSSIARQLASPECETPLGRLERSQRLKLSRTTQPPAIPAGLDSDASFISQLAHILEVPEASLRLAWTPGSEIRFGRPVEITIGDREARMEETVFLGQLLFARQWQDHWCVGEVPPLAWYNHWQVSVALMLLLSLATLLLLAWLFARWLSRPIHDFANAADTIGRDEQAPFVEEKGPRELRIAARALNAMQARIHEQLQERESMVAAIAHDLRTPLSRIAFRVETAAPEISDSVQRDVEQMNAMITATLEFAREGSLPRDDKLINLHDLLQGMVEDEVTIGHPATFSASSKTIMVRGNDIQLSRLFQNLLDNAWNFGGSVEVRLDRRDGVALVVIADRGPGMDEDQIEKMFRPFIRGEPSRNRKTGGIGLGLSITRAIAHRHGGEVQIANREGGGLLVTVFLPLASE